MARAKTVRINVNIPEELLQRLDEYARGMNVTRTSAMCFLMSQALDSQRAMNDLGKLVQYFQEKSVQEGK